jgi:hypothetical protein
MASMGALENDISIISSLFDRALALLETTPTLAPLNELGPLKNGLFTTDSGDLWPPITRVR